MQDLIPEDLNLKVLCGVAGGGTLIKEFNPEIADEKV
jgi:hypothetical protein